MTGEAWEAIRPNLSSIAEATDWWHVVEGPVTADIPPEDRAYLAEAAAMLETLPFGTDVWQALTGTLKDATGRKGKPLFLPRSEEHTSELQSLMRISYAVFCLKKKNKKKTTKNIEIDITQDTYNISPNVIILT